ncbi:MAG: hypothetical protein LBO06_02795 [Bacteroidales bacterium]|jgi:hypothetical protein|nr:hypothetical protein [Bacteroidales bacterium]
MRNADWIKIKEEEIRIQATNNYEYYSQSEAVSDEDKARFDAALTKYTATLLKTSEVSLRTRVDVIAKNIAKAALKAIMREFYRKYVIGNTTMPNAKRLEFEFPVYDTKPTPIKVPIDPPHIEIDFSFHGAHMLYFSKFNTLNKVTRGLPKGAHGVEVYRHIGGDLIDNYGDFEFIGLESKSPMKIIYSTSLVGTKVWYAARFFNVKGGVSGWSKIKMALVN